MADETDTSGETLSGGWQTTVRRRGDVVRRSSGPWSRSVLALLRHLEAEGFSAAPCVVEPGFDEQGNETLAFMEGESIQPRPWAEPALDKLGTMIAALHAASGSFQADAGAVWKDWFGRTLGDPASGFGHGDLGPWNILAINDAPVAFIDWDTAGPMDPVWEVAQAAWLNVQLHDDDLAERLGLGDALTRAGHLNTFLDGYGLARSGRAGFVDKMVEVAAHDAADQAATHGIHPETTTGVADNGYPFAWGMAWRIRGASWMLRNRHTLEQAIGAA